MDLQRKQYEQFIKEEIHLPSEKWAARFKNGDRVLLIGTDSLFLSLARRLGIQVDCVEAEALKECLFDRYDGIIIAHRLECVKDPLLFLQEVREKLQPTGRLFLSLLCHGEKEKITDHLRGMAPWYSRPEHFFSVDEAMRLLDQLHLYVDRNEVLRSRFPLQMVIEASLASHHRERSDIA